MAKAKETKAPRAKRTPTFLEAIIPIIVMLVVLTIGKGIMGLATEPLLLLVTCEYVHDNGRFVVALRELRDGETEEQMRELMRDAKEK